MILKKNPYSDIIMFRTAPEIVDQHQESINKWIKSGPGRIYQFMLTPSDPATDEIGPAVVKELCKRGYAANGHWSKFSCVCGEHNGAEIGTGVYEIQVMRHPS